MRAVDLLDSEDAPRTPDVAHFEDGRIWIQPRNFVIDDFT